MERIPSQDKIKSESQSLADLSLERLPRPADLATSRWAGYGTTPSPELIRRHERRVAAREKRSKRASAEKAECLSRDGILARLWHAAAVGDPRVGLPHEL